VNRRWRPVCPSGEDFKDEFYWFKRIRNPLHSAGPRSALHVKIIYQVFCFTKFSCFVLLAFVFLSGVPRVVCGAHLSLVPPWATRLLSQWMLHWWRVNGNTARAPNHQRQTRGWQAASTIFQVYGITDRELYQNFTRKIKAVVMKAHMKNHSLPR